MFLYPCMVFSCLMLTVWICLFHYNVWNLNVILSSCGKYCRRDMHSRFPWWRFVQSTNRQLLLQLSAIMYISTDWSVISVILVQLFRKKKKIVVNLIVHSWGVWSRPCVLRLALAMSKTGIYEQSSSIWVLGEESQSIKHFLSEP